MEQFDDIRPYTDEELPAALQRITEWSDFPQAIKFIYPNGDINEIKKKLLSITTIHEFQATLMYDAISRIINTTTNGFTHSGLNHLRRGVAYLFVSNHRDITLDAFLPQRLLIEHRGDTSHIVFGQNLLSLPSMEVLFRSNKLIRMERGGTPRAFYDSLHHLSAFLSHLIIDQRQSVWIAQKNGRAKDGNDITAPAMIKMLCLGCQTDPLRQLNDLHLVPVSISYEWDPCDLMKAHELYQSQRGKYQKAPDEDIKSVVSGIIGPKGKVHLAIGAPLSHRELIPPDGEDIFEHVASLIDRRIHGNYRLMPTNYAAHALLTGQHSSGRYTQHTIDGLKARLSKLPNEEMRRLLLENYATPVINSR